MTSRRTSLFLLLLCSSFLLQPAASGATPEEDHAKGARIYAQGDVVTAMSVLKGPADAGHAAAQALYAQILDSADSDEEALAYFRKSANQGNAEGQFGLGSMLASGEGGPRNPAEGLKWISLAGNQGHKLAINEMALAHINARMGGVPVVTDDAETLRWVRLAAGNDFLPALEALTEAFRKGTLGLPVDLKQADQMETRARAVKGLKGKRKGDRK
jgi:hypothetical protein